MTPCPRCPNLHTGRGLCPDCRRRMRKASRARNPRTDASYATTKWRTTRAAFLERNPTCIDCGHPAQPLAQQAIEQRQQRTTTHSDRRSGVRTLDASAVGVGFTDSEVRHDF